MYTPEQIARFWARADQSGGAMACWPWQGSRNPDGYGKLTGNRYAHRVAYTLHVGAIPDGLVLDHLCRNPSCVNPAHLEAVTNRTNIMRGRAPGVLAHNERRCTKGHDLTPDNMCLRNTSDGPVARCLRCAREDRKQSYYRCRERLGLDRKRFKLTAEQVQEIRAAVDMTQEDLARIYGCTQTNISCILAGKTWRHLLP